MAAVEYDPCEVCAGRVTSHRTVYEDDERLVTGDVIPLQMARVAYHVVEPCGHRNRSVAWRIPEAP